jgi:hypothetical protein
MLSSVPDAISKALHNYYFVIARSVSDVAISLNINN